MFNGWMIQWLKLHCAIKNHLKDFIWNWHKCPCPIRFNISLKIHGYFANLVSESARDKAQQKSFINFVTKTLEFFYKNWTWEKREAFSWKYPECMFESLISTVTHLAEVFNKMHNSKSHRNTLQNNWEFLFFVQNSYIYLPATFVNVHRSSMQVYMAYKVHPVLLRLVDMHFNWLFSNPHLMNIGPLRWIGFESDWWIDDMWVTDSLNEWMVGWMTVWKHGQ